MLHKSQFGEGVRGLAAENARMRDVH